METLGQNISSVLRTTTITSTASIRRTSPGTRCASGRRKTLLAHGPRWRASMGSGSGSAATPLMHGAGFRRRMAMMRKDLWLASAYDAYTLRKGDGMGQWWEGLDPQELYTGRNMVIPDGLSTIKAQNDWHDGHEI